MKINLSLFYFHVIEIDFALIRILYNKRLYDKCLIKVTIEMGTIANS